MAAAAVLQVAESKSPTSRHDYPTDSAAPSAASTSAAHKSAFRGDLPMDPSSLAAARSGGSAVGGADGRPVAYAAYTHETKATAIVAARERKATVATERRNIRVTNDSYDHDSESADWTRTSCYTSSEDIHTVVSATTATEASHIERIPRFPARGSAAAGGAAGGGACHRTYSVRPKRQPVLRHAAEVILFPRASFHRASDRRGAADSADHYNYNSESGHSQPSRPRLGVGQSTRRALTRSASFVGGDSGALSSSDSSFAFHVSASGTAIVATGSAAAGDAASAAASPEAMSAEAAAAAVVAAGQSSPVYSAAETGGEGTPTPSSMGSRSPSRAPSDAAAATAAAQTVSPGKGASGSFAIGSRGGPRSPTPPTSPAVPRTPSLCLPPSPASSRRTQPPPSPSYASARPLPPTSPSVSPRRASPVSSPCDSPSSSFSFAVPRATSHEYRAAVAATINGVSGSGGGGGGIGGSKSGQQGKLLRSVSSQWDSSSRSLRAGRNLAGSSPNRMLSVNVHLQAAIACVATDSASVAADSSSAAAESPCVAEASPSAPPAAARSATAGGILRRGGLKRMPSLDTMSSPAYATSPPSPASSPLTRAAAAAGGAGGAASSTASAGVNDTAYTTAAAAISASSAAHHSRGLSLGDSPPTPSLGESPITTPQLSPGPSPGRGHVRRVSFCSMVRVRRFSACDADLGPAADAAITAFEEAEAAAAAARAAAAAATKAAAAEAAAEAAREADAKARVHPASTVSRHPMHRGSRSLIERPHHSQSPPYFGANQTNPGQRVAGTSESLIECSHRHSRSPSYSGVFPLSPDLSGPSQAIRRTSSFQHSGPGSPARYSRSHGYSAAAAAAPRGSEERRGGSRSRTHTPGIEISGVSEEHGEPQLAIPNLTPGSNEHQLGIRTPVPPKMPSPRLAPSPRVQRLLQHMWGDVGDGNEAA